MIPVRMATFCYSMTCRKTFNSLACVMYMQLIQLILTAEIITKGWKNIFFELLCIFCALFDSTVQKPIELWSGNTWMQMLRAEHNVLHFKMHYRSSKCIYSTWQQGIWALDESLRQQFIMTPKYAFTQGFTVSFRSTTGGLIINHDEATV